MSGRLKIELIRRACVSEKSKSWRMKLQKVHVFKRLTSDVNFFPLELLSPNKYSWCVWFEQVTWLLLAAAKHWHLYQKTHSQPKGQGQLCNFWWKKRGCIYCGLNWSRFTLGIRLSSSYLRGRYDLSWFLILLKLSVAFCSWLYPISCLLIPAFCSVSSLVLEIMTSETLFLNHQRCANKILNCIFLEFWTSSCEF